MTVADSAATYMYYASKVNRSKTKYTRFFRVSSSVQNTVSIREEFKYAADFIQIQPFLELKEPEISLKSPNFLESPNFNYLHIFLGVGTRNRPGGSQIWVGSLHLHRTNARHDK